MIQSDAADAAALVDAKPALLCELHATPEFEGERIDVVLLSARLHTELSPVQRAACGVGARPGAFALMAFGRAKLDAALAECALHAQVLVDAVAALPSEFSAATVTAVDGDSRRWLDQAAYRFMKLQDSLGEKALPGLLAATLDPLPP